MTINERFREVRKSTGLTMAEFGEKIGLSASGVSNIESGQRRVTKKHIIILNSMFGIREEWLQFGTGGMCEDNSEAVDALIDAMLIGEKETAKAVFKALARLGGDEWAAFKKFILDAAKELKE